MVKQIREKLRSRSGESLGEVLVALLIIALSSMLLVVMMNTAGSIDRNARLRDKTFYDDLKQAETHTAGAGSEQTGTIIIKDDGSFSREVGVTIYGGSGLTSYAVTDGGASP